MVDFCFLRSSPIAKKTFELSFSNLPRRGSTPTGPRTFPAYYAVDATHVNLQGEWVRSRAELVPYFALLVAGRSDSFDAAFDIEAVRFVTDDVALVDGTLVIRGMRGRDGDILPRLLERFAFVLKKTGGRWEITASRVMFPAD